MADAKRTNRRITAGLLAAGLLLLGPTAARALRYKPKADETLSHIAVIHYGSAKKAIYLIAGNRITDPSKIQPGKALWVPTVWRYRIKRGDDLARLARKYLKDSDRADFLIWLNQIKDPKDLKIGRLITVPFLLRHRVQEGQNMVDLARRYYFKSQPAGLLRKFNKKRTNALKPGEIILVPIFDPEAASDKVKQRLERYQQRVAEEAKEARERALRQAAALAKEREAKKAEQAAQARQDSKDQGPAPAAASPDEPGPEAGGKSVAELDAGAVLADPGSQQDGQDATPPADAKLVREAFDLYRDGEYELAKANLTRVLEAGRLSRADEAEAREVLAYCLVAMDQPKEAEHEFVRLLMVAPDRTLDPITTSPKVLEVFRKAKGNR